jgi:hypothetical protein
VYLVAALAVCLVLCLSLAVCLAGSPRPLDLALAAVPVSEGAAESGERKLQAVLDAPLGPFAVAVSESEVTSLLALRVPGSPFMRPQVHLSGGKIHISGDVSMGAVLRVKSTWSASTQGGFARVHLERASIGPLALPQALLGSVSSTINQMIDESGTGIMPTAIIVGDGTARIEGVKSPPTVP